MKRELRRESKKRDIAMVGSNLDDALHEVFLSNGIATLDDLLQNSWQNILHGCQSTHYSPCLPRQNFVSILTHLVGCI